MDNKHIKECSTVLAIREMQSKTVRIAIITKIDKC